MAWFTSDFHHFFKALKAHNNRDWFQARKSEFEQSVLHPFERFIGALLRHFEEEGQALHITPKQCIYRIYRDIRFSKDKTPYKTQMSAILTPGGRKAEYTMGLYIEMSDTGLYIYEGFFKPPKPLLEKIRYAIAADPGRFNDILYNPDLTAAFSGLLGDKNKRLPKEFQDAAKKQPLLFHKSFYFRAELPPEVLLSDNLVDIVWQYHQLSGEFNNFLLEAIHSV